MPRLVHRHRYEWRRYPWGVLPGDMATCACGARIAYEPRWIEQPYPAWPGRWKSYRLLTRGVRVVRELGGSYLDELGRPWTALLLAQVPVEQLGRVLGEGVYLRG